MKKNKRVVAEREREALEPDARLTQMRWISRAGSDVLRTVKVVPMSVRPSKMTGPVGLVRYQTTGNQRNRHIAQRAVMQLNVRLNLKFIADFHLFPLCFRKINQASLSTRLILSPYCSFNSFHLLSLS